MNNSVVHRARFASVPDQVIDKTGHILVTYALKEIVSTRVVGVTMVRLPGAALHYEA